MFPNIPAYTGPCDRDPTREFEASSHGAAGESKRLARVLNIHVRRVR